MQDNVNYVLSPGLETFIYNHWLYLSSLFLEYFGI